MRNLIALTAASALFVSTHAGPGVTFPGGPGPGQGKHIVLLAGDEEYRSEEAMPMLGQVLSVRHGFKCTVLFSTNPETGEIDPNNQVHIPGLEALAGADLVILFLRFRELPDDQMKHVVDYFLSGKPIIGLRTSTHAFSYSRNRQSPYAKYDWRSKEWPGGFGQQVLGETWINHHGIHGKEATRGLIKYEMRDHPILRGVRDVWGPTDVYGLANYPADARTLLYGEVVAGMEPTDPGVIGPKNNPMMPVAWIREYPNPAGRTNRVFTTTMGSSTDFESADLRRLLVNACYWAVGIEDRIPAQANVDYVTPYKATPFGFNGYQKGMKPSDYALPNP